MLLLHAAIAAADKPTTIWYGPETVTAPLTVSGNPYDPAENDVDVDFVAADGSKLRRLAFFVGDGKFSSTLVAPKPGKYIAHFILNGKDVYTSPNSVDVENKLTHGFIGLKGRRFAWTDGTPYFPIGYDYGWKGIPNETVAQGMTRMGEEGANWSRIWTSHWDNKNPFFPSATEKVEPRQLRQEPLQIWDDICAAAEKAGVSFQFVLFHHGPYSTTTDSNWKEHPWNTANGGLLKDPTDFFIDPEAKRRTKIWLRYAVARYASSPAVMAWELFNEVQWVDAIKKNPGRVGDVAAWHKEMIAYVKSLDPYHHLVTSSSSETLDSHIFDDVDYMQPHTYPANVLASIGGYEFKSKPGFFGEFGPPGGGRGADGQAVYRKQVRDGIYGGMLAGHAGAGEYWFWDQVARQGLAPDFKAARRVIDESGLLDHPNAKPLSVWVDTPRRADLTVSAGGGWQKSSLFELDLPRVDERSLGKWSQYFQSLDGANKGWAKPLVVKFDAPEAGKALLGVGQTSTGGATLAVWVNGKSVLDQKFDAPAAGARPARGARTPIAIDYPAGPVTIRIENHGADWVQLNSITVPGIGSTAMAHGMEDSRWALIRVVGSDTNVVDVSGLKLADGVYSAKIFDTESGARTDREFTLSGGKFSAQALPHDCVIALQRR